jgi:hypothetical protein
MDPAIFCGCGIDLVDKYETVPSFGRDRYITMTKVVTIIPMIHRMSIERTPSKVFGMLLQIGEPTENIRQYIVSTIQTPAISNKLAIVCVIADNTLRINPMGLIGGRYLKKLFICL